MKRLALPVLLLLPALALAQTPAPRGTPPAATPPPATAAQPLWRCELPGGVYEVAVRALVAVSSHEYVVDGVARVTEVNLDTGGSVLARFYHIEPQTPSGPLGIGTAALDRAQQLLTDGAEKSGQDVWKKVVKSYPATTHARTVEYRVASRPQLQQLFESAGTAFRTGKAGTFRAQ